MTRFLASRREETDNRKKIPNDKKGSAEANRAAHCYLGIHQQE
ncbi:hypothetical protein [Pseudomonas panipatensis]|jgi:hypothetical protein|nr:hypothetical protein [Pseudomonas panipatensis]